MECPAQLEASVNRIHVLEGEERLEKLGGGAAVEVRILRVHIRKDFILRGNYVDPEQWLPLIYNFRHYFELGAERPFARKSDVALRRNASAMGDELALTIDLLQLAVPPVP